MTQVYRIMGWPGEIQEAEILSAVQKGGGGRAVARVYGSFFTWGPSAEFQQLIAFQVRDMIETFVHREEILSPASGPELRKQQKEMQHQVRSDKAPGGPGLFRGIFTNAILYGIRDPEDGVIRCPRCMWEVHGGRCENPDCGARVHQLRDGHELDDSESGSDTEGGSDLETDGGIGAPDRWPESIVGEEDDWEDAGDDDDDDGFDDVDDVSVRRRFAPYGAPENRFFGQNQRRIGNSQEPEDSDEGEEEGSDGTVGSLADFLDDDSPQQSRRVPGRGGPWALTSPPAQTSSPARASIAAARRQSARPIIIDDDDDDDAQSSFSEASSRPAVGTRRNNRYQNSRHASLSSDYDDDEQSLLDSNGYQALLGNQTDHTATEDEDDGFSSPPIRSMAGRRNGVGRGNGPGSVFSVPEEDEFGDADESEDQDGDVVMTGSQQSRNTGPAARQQARRSNSGQTRSQPVELDSASESEVAASRRRRRTSAQTSQAARNNYYSNHQRNGNGGSRNRNNRPNMEVDPSIFGLFSQHGQQLRETQFNALGRNSSLVSPARSLTPVQRPGSGRRSSAANRGGTPLSPLRTMHDATMLSSPMQASLNTTPQRQPPSSIPGTSSPAQITPGNNNPWQRGVSLSPRQGGLSYGQSIFSQFMPRRISSPAVRVRSRTSTRELRSGAGSRMGMRNHSNTPTSPHAQSSFTGGTSIAGLQGRVPPPPPTQQPQHNQPTAQQRQQLQQIQHQQLLQRQRQQQIDQQIQHQIQQSQQSQQSQQAQQSPQQSPQQRHQQLQQPQQQRQRQPLSAPPQIPPRPGPDSPSRNVTPEDIRARGEQIRQQQLRMINGGGPLRPSSGEGTNGGGNGSNGSSPSNAGVEMSDNLRRGSRLGALIGGGPADQRGGGPMLVVGRDDEHTY